MRRATLLLLSVLLLPRLSLAGGLPVFDAGLNTLGLQDQWLQMKALWESVEQTLNQVKQLEQQARQITGMYTQIDQGIKNLASLDLNNIQDLYGAMNMIQGKLHQAEYIGYQAQHAVTQAQGLYPRIYGVMHGPQRRQLTMQWAAMRRNAAQVSISTQAIRDTQARYQQQWADLIRQAEGKGNVQVQQTQVQAQAVLGHQLMAIEQQLATQARERSEQAMEQATRTEIEQYLEDEAFRPLEGT